MRIRNFIGCIHGAVLPMAMAVLLILSILVLSFVSVARQRLLLSDRFSDNLDAEILTMTGIELCKREIFLSFVSQVPLHERCFTFESNGDVRSVEMDPSARESSDNKSCWFVIRDEQSKLNINSITREQLMRIPDVSASVADCILDWRDEDGDCRSLGAESEYYRNLGNPYSCKNGPFECLEELWLVKGVDSIMYSRLEKYLTAFGNGKINLNTCSSEVLWIAGLNESVAIRLVETVSGPDGMAGTTDDVVVEDTDSILVMLTDRFVLEDSEINELNEFIAVGILGTASESHMVRLFVALPNDDFAVSSTGVIEIDGRMVPTIRFWNEM